MIIEELDMSKYELELNIAQGKLLVPFDSVSELEQKLKDLDTKALEQTLALYVRFTPKGEPRKVKGVLEGICNFRADGTLEFEMPAGSKLETIGLVLFAYDPDPVDVATVGKLVAEQNPAAYFCHKQYSRYFSKIGAGLYGLSHDGKIWVANEVLPRMKTPGG
jgi:hypothetical protein